MKDTDAIGDLPEEVAPTPGVPERVPPLSDVAEHRAERAEEQLPGVIESAEGDVDLGLDEPEQPPRKRVIRRRGFWRRKSRRAKPEASVEASDAEVVDAQESDKLPSDWRSLTREIQQPEKRARRAERRQRYWRTVRITAWLVAFAVPISLLFYDAQVTGRCQPPLLMEYARTRSVWHTTWAISFLVAAVMTLICIYRASDPWLTRMTVLFLLSWKAAVLLRDRVSLPACAQGWADDVARHTLELPLNVMSGLFFAFFVVALGVTARQKRLV